MHEVSVFEQETKALLFNMQMEEIPRTGIIISNNDGSVFYKVVERVIKQNGTVKLFVE